MNEIGKDELKQVQLDILKVVTEFCSKNGIIYYLCGGTLIGAVRHQGYIPWDDDIDIALLRKDYEFFIKNFNEYNSLYKIYESKNTKWYPYPFAKVSYLNSLIVESNDNMLHNIGINIDIFPIDNLPDDIPKQRKLLKKIKRWRYLLDIKAIKINKKRPIYKNIVLLIGKLIFKCLSPNTIANKIELIATQFAFHDTNNVGVIVWGYGESEVVNKNIFSETVKLKFENEYYNAPKKYDEWLTSIYGNYMTLPPVEKQISHHSFKAYINK